MALLVTLGACGGGGSSGGYEGLTFQRLEGGAESKLGEYFGAPLVVNFFAAWCPPCERELPEFEMVHQELGDEVRFLGLSQDANPDDALELLERTGVTFDTGSDRDLEIFQAVDGLAMPTTAFFNSDGELVDIFGGALDAESLRTKIAAVMGAE